MGNANSSLDPVFLLAVLGWHNINQPGTQLPDAIGVQAPTVRSRLECLGFNRVCIGKFRNCHGSLRIAVAVKWYAGEFFVAFR